MRPYRPNSVRRRQAGLSNIQIMIGVLISAIVIMGGITMIDQIDKAKADNEASELVRYKKKTTSLGAQRGNFSGVTLQTVIALDFFDAKSISGAAGSRIVRNQWSGTIDVTPENFAGTWDALKFRYTGLSSSTCKQLAMRAAGTASGISIGGTWVKTTPALGGTGALNTANLVTSCGQPGNNLAIDFYLTK